MRYWLALVVLARVASASPLPIDAAGSVRDPDVAERAARAYVAAHGELGVRADELVVVANRLDGGVRSVGFRQTWHGAPVIAGQIGFAFSHDRLFAVFPHLVAGVHASAPVRGHAILRTPTGDRLVDVREDERATIYLDASDGREVARQSKISDATSTLRYDVGVRYATGLRDDQPAPAASITVNGSAATTGADGSFSWSGASAASVMPSVVGSFVQIVNQAGALATATLTAQPGQPTVWSLASDEQGDAQLSAFVYVGIAKARARIVNPAVASWLDTVQLAYVNETGSCNAFATANDVHFVRASATCQNSARVADIVYHEFGHVLHQHSIIPGMGMFDQQLSEGLADWGAANINEDSAIGRGLYYDDTPARDIDPYGHERRWPDDIDLDPHITGLIVSGALWDLRKALVRAFGHDPGVAQAEAIFTGVMQRAVDIPSSYTAALVADDNDGNLANGTPHFCLIEQAFGVHGLAEPDFQTTAIGSPAVDSGLNISVAVTTPTGRACPPPQVTSITVTWRVGDGVPNELALSPQGATWTGAFPMQRPGALLAYSVDAALDDGSHVVLPDNPADPEYEQFVGTPVPIACWSMDQDPQWSQTGNLGNEWMWGQAGFSSTVSRDPRAAHTGGSLLGTNLTGAGDYQPNEITTVLAPTTTISAFEIVHLQYWRWLAVEDSAYDHADIAVNGQRVWRNASNLGGTLDHVDKEWRFQDIDLTPFVADQTAQIAWSITSDGSKQLGGWSLDDVCIVGLPKTPVCGDGFVDLDEQCDDGNTNDGDGCSAKCMYEIAAGGGGCEAGDRPGALAIALVVYFACRRFSRRLPSRSVSLRMP